MIDMHQIWFVKLVWAELTEKENMIAEWYRQWVERFAN